MSLPLYTATMDVFGGHFGVQMLGLTTIVALTVPALVARLSPLTEARRSGGHDGPVIEETAKAFTRSQSVLLAVGAAAGIIDVFITVGRVGRNDLTDSRWVITGAWVRSKPLSRE